MSTTLRPAKELTAEFLVLSKKAFDFDIARAATAIEEAHAEGRTEVTCLPFFFDVVAHLRELGYKVTHNKACDKACDMDSDTISWKE